MKHPKGHYRKITYGGYKWYGFIGGLHYFSKKVDKGYMEIRCTEEHLENGDFEFMVDNGLTMPETKRRSHENSPRGLHRECRIVII